MIRLPEAIARVMPGTLVGGAAGGITGYAIGRVAPSFVRWLTGPGAAGDAAKLGFGLEIVGGLFLGTGASLILATAILIRNGIVTRDRDGGPGHGRTTREES
ncbi:MAG: hypothetical protein KatS3mg108_0586 [Isosphaeraceae bacterium]|nr:MAG: hypothetical protein KatS3mg108_0586 [Isosphaeraceae bacterium]